MCFKKSFIKMICKNYSFVLLPIDIESNCYSFEIDLSSNSSLECT